MRVTALRAHIVSLPLRDAIQTPVEREAFPLASVDCVVTRVATDDGLEGVGVAWTTGLAKAHVIKAMVVGLKSVVRGADPTMSEQIWARMSRHTNTIGHSGIASIAMSAIDIALWDLRGKIANLPVYKLLGGATTELPAYASGLFLTSPIEDIVAEAKRYVAAGFRSFKMRVGRPALAEDLERIAAVRRAVGDEVGIMVDAAQAWDTRMALTAGRAFETFGLEWIEDPVVFDNVDGLVAVAAALDTPITAGEKLYNRYDFRQLIERRAADILMPDVQRVGVAEWMRVGALAHTWNLPVVAHAMPEVSVHLLAATPAALTVEYLTWWSRLFTHPLTVTARGTVSPPDRPGFGIELNEAVLAEYAVD